MPCWVWRVLGLLSALAFAEAAVAGPISAGGLTFSDELGGFSILGVSGSGSLGDPFVVVEELHSSDEAVLVIRGLTANFGNKIGTQHLTGFALQKIVVNHSSSDWNLFQVELRKQIDIPSSYGDGLSFGQGSTIGRPFASDTFAANEVTDEPYDAITFRDGTVRAGERASFHFVITDTSPVSPFFLIQEPTHIVAAVPPGGGLTPCARP
jgi:hypothetical protein